MLPKLHAHDGAIGMQAVVALADLAREKRPRSLLRRAAVRIPRVRREQLREGDAVALGKVIAQRQSDPAPAIGALPSCVRTHSTEVGVERAVRAEHAGDQERVAHEAGHRQREREPRTPGGCNTTAALP